MVAAVYRMMKDTGVGNVVWLGVCFVRLHPSGM